MILKNEDFSKNYIINIIISLFSIELVWFVVIMLSQSWPSWDNMEQLVLASSFEVLYPKHPPLTTWILYPLTLLFGKKPWLTVFLSYTSISIAQYFIFLLLRDIQKKTFSSLGERASYLAIFCSSLVFYYTFGGSIYNHNTMQLCTTAGAIYFYYATYQLEQKNSATNYFSRWLFFGLFASLSLLAKYSSVIHLSLLGIHFIWKKRFLNKNAILGFLIFCLIVLLMTYSHLSAVYEAYKMGESPLSYLLYSFDISIPNKSDGSSIIYVNFILGCVWNVAPMLLILWVVKRNNLKTAKTQKKYEGKTFWECLTFDNKIFLLGLIFLPTIITLVIAIINGIYLDSKWAFTFFLPVGAMLWFCIKVDGNYDYLIKLVVKLHIFFIIIFLSVRFLDSNFTHRQSLVDFPGEKFSQILFDRWEESKYYTHGEKIHLIAGDVWSTGLLVLNNKKNNQEIKILLNGDYSQSRWLKEEDKKGFILVVLNKKILSMGSSSSEAKLNLANLQALIDKSEVRGHEKIIWFDDKPPIEFDWGIYLQN